MQIQTMDSSKSQTQIEKLCTQTQWKILGQVLWYNIHIQTFKVEMKGRKRSLCSPPSYRLSGARFEVATRIYTCLPPQTQHTIVMLTSAKTFKVLLHREQKKTEEIKLLTIPLLNRCPNRRFSINASATSFT